MPKAKNKNRKIKAVNILVIVIVTISIAALFYYFIRERNKPKTTFKQDKYTVFGVDLSHHNPIIDWAEVHDQKITFVYIKTTGGVSHEDRNYIYNYKSAKKNGIKVGSYHFYLFAASGKEQAQHFIENVSIETGDLYPAIDVEHSPDNPYSTDTSYVNLVVKELKALENSLYEYYGVHPIIYTNKDCYKLYINNNFENNYIWMCDLKSEPDYVNNWIIWQFSHTGELQGVVGDIDLNYYRYPYESLNKIMMP